jgi:transcriptional repressor NrdR
MRCPFCLTPDSQVRDSRPAEDGAAIRRRRHCAACGARFTTFERVVLRDLVVVKRSGARESFDRDKLTRSVRVACRKRPVSDEAIERLVSGVARRLEASGEGEVPAQTIGGAVMDGLKGLDHVAWIRFASVYRDFSEAGDFAQIVVALGGEPLQPAGSDDPAGAPDAVGANRDGA